MRRRSLPSLLLFLALGAAPAPVLAQDGVIILVRHAETTPDGTRNPALSPDGVERAARLADLLADAGLDGVYTTDYDRTRSTAGAVARPLGLEPVLYDPGALHDFAAQLLTSGGRVLVVGHSNTTPSLVELLGGDAGPAISEHEHDRLYLLFPAAEGVRTVVLRYGGS